MRYSGNRIGIEVRERGEIEDNKKSIAMVRVNNVTRPSKKMLTEPNA